MTAILSSTTHHYCTLFDSNYLNRGLALYESLKQHAKAFHLYIFCFDDRVYQVLSGMQLEYVTLISLEAFEDKALLAVKPTRTMGEYCWTCTSSIIRYVLKHYTVPACTYLDADLYFYSDPRVLIEEMGQNDVLLTEHRYSLAYDNTALSGRFCVQFMTFRNNPNGLAVLEWWREACLAWCFNRVEDGKFGDQKYLDDWPTRFTGIYISQHLGCGIAPWNVQRYQFNVVSNQVHCQFGNQNSNNQPVVFYHFHGLKFYPKHQADLGQYKLSQNAINCIYDPYLKHLYNINQSLTNKLENPFVDSFAAIPTYLEKWKRKWRGNLNIIDLSGTPHV